MKPDFECLCLHPVFWNWTCRAKGQIWFRNRGSKLFSNIVKHTLSRLWAVPPAVAVPASQWSADLSGSKFRFVKSTHFTQLKSCCIHYDLKLVMDPIGRVGSQTSELIWEPLSQTYLKLTYFGCYLDSQQHICQIWERSDEQWLPMIGLEHTDIIRISKIIITVN